MKKSAASRYVAVVLQAFAVSLLAVLFWKFILYDNGIYFSHDAENTILYLMIPPVGFIYVIFASLAVSSVFDQYKQISRSVVRKDLDTFLEHRDQQLPVLMHILISVPSVILILLAMAYQYHDFHAGIAAVFLVTFVIAITWFIVNELDNHHRRAHAKQVVPKHWHEIKTHEHFKENGK